MKKRAANFTPEEKTELLDSVLKHRNVLFGRVGLPSRYWESKKEAWTEIVDAVNSARPSPGRSVHECRRKLKDLKAATRKKYMDLNGAWKKDVDVKDATPEEQKILKLLTSGDNMDNVEIAAEKAEGQSSEDAVNLPAVTVVKIEDNTVLESMDVDTSATANSDIAEANVNEAVATVASTVIRPIPPLAATPPVHPQATMKVEPMVRPVGQVVPVPANEQNQGQAQGQGSSQGTTQGNAQGQAQRQAQAQGTTQGNAQGQAQRQAQAPGTTQGNAQGIAQGQAQRQAHAQAHIEIQRDILQHVLSSLPTTSNQRDAGSTPNQSNSGTTPNTNDRQEAHVFLRRIDYSMYQRRLPPNVLPPGIQLNAARAQNGANVAVNVPIPNVTNMFPPGLTRRFKPPPRRSEQNRRPDQQRPVQASDQRRPFAELTTPTPVKRIKLFVRNLCSPPHTSASASTSTSTTTVSAADNNNTVSFTICPCHTNMAPKATQHVGVQTVDNDTLIQRIIDAQRSTERAVNSLADISTRMTANFERMEAKVYEFLGHEDEQKQEEEQVVDGGNAVAADAEKSQNNDENYTETTILGMDLDKDEEEKVEEKPTIKKEVDVGVQTDKEVKPRPSQNQRGVGVGDHDYSKKQEEDEENKENVF